MIIIQAKDMNDFSFGYCHAKNFPCQLGKVFQRYTNTQSFAFQQSPSPLQHGDNNFCLRQMVIWRKNTLKQCALQKTGWIMAT